MSPDPGKTIPTSASNAGSDLKVVCPKCGELRGSRIKRKGFLQKQIMPFFGYYPWQCGACRHQWNSKLRGERKRRTRSSSTEPKAFVEPQYGFDEALLPTPQRTSSAGPQPSRTLTRRPVDNDYEDDSHEEVE